MKPCHFSTPVCLILGLVAFGCGGSGPDPSSARLEVVSIGGKSSDSRCEAGGAWAAGSSVRASAWFTRPCRGFFGYGNSCKPLSDVTFDLATPSRAWTSSQFVLNVDGYSDVSSIDLAAVGDGEATLTPKVKSESFASVKLSASSPTGTIRVERLLRHSQVYRFEKVEKLNVAIGGKVLVIASVFDSSGKALCGQPPIQTPANASVTIKPEGAPTDSVVWANSDLVISGVSPFQGVLALTSQAATLSWPVEIVDLSAITSVTGELRGPRASSELRLHALVGSSELDGVNFHLVNRSPELLSLLSLQAPVTELDLEDPVVPVRLGATDGGTATLGITINGSTAPERMLQLAIPGR